MTELAELPETGTGSIPVELSRRLVAEALGTGLLIIAVIGSGIMASRLSPSDIGDDAVPCLPTATTWR